MGQNTSQIEREIVAERDQLGRNLNELEMKAQQLSDWHTHYRKNPKVLLGIALTGGFVLGTMAGRGRSSRAYDTPEPMPLTQAGNRARRQIEDTWLTISDALLGVASAKVLSLVASVVPGFSEQVRHSQFGNGSDRRSSTR